MNDTSLQAALPQQPVVAPQTPPLELTPLAPQQPINLPESPAAPGMAPATAEQVEVLPPHTRKQAELRVANAIGETIGHFSGLQTSYQNELVKGLKVRLETEGNRIVAHLNVDQLGANAATLQQVLEHSLRRHPLFGALSHSMPVRQDMRSAIEITPVKHITDSTVTHEIEIRITPRDYSHYLDVMKHLAGIRQHAHGPASAAPAVQAPPVAAAPAAAPHAVPKAALIQGPASVTERLAELPALPALAPGV